LYQFASGETKEDIRISLDHLMDFRSEFFLLLVYSPIRFLRIGNEVVKDRVREILKGYDQVELFPPRKEKYPQIYLIDPPDMLHSDINRIRDADIGKLISIEGHIKRIDDVSYRAVEMAFRCRRCQAVIRVQQDYMKTVEPLACVKEQGGCGSTAARTRFKHVPSLDQSLRTQIIYIEESLESVAPQRQPEQLYCFLDGTDCGNIFPGNKVRLTGFLDITKKKKGTKPIYNFYFRVAGIDIIQQKFIDIEVNDEEMKKIRKISESPDLFSKLSRLIAPELYGLDDIKEAILLQLFGSPEFNKNTGVHFRGNIHILLAGDPSTGKSKLLEYVSSIVPRGIYTSGRGASAAGLTATVERDELTGKWFLVGGAIVMANDGICAIDELDKMRKTGTDSLLQAMSSQKVPIDKASIHATLISKTSVLSAANPKMGRFTPSLDLNEQLKIAPELISRFDLTFILRDIADVEQDEAMGAHILSYWDTEDNFPIDRDLLIKYIAVAKRHNPRIPIDLKRKILDYYKEIRAKFKQFCIMSIDSRHLQGIMRLSMASARGRLSDEVNEEDVDRAINLVSECIKKLSPKGVMDIDILETGLKGDTRNLMIKVLDIFHKLNRCDEFERGVPLFKIVEVAAGMGLGQGRVTEAVNKLTKSEPKELYEIGHRKYIAARG